MLAALLPRLIVALCLLSSLRGQQPAVDSDFGDPNSPAAGFGKGSRMDYGPFLTYTISADRNATQSGNYLAVKGLAIQLDGTNAAVCFDTDTLRMAAGWTGGFLDISGTHLDSYKGSHPAFVAGNIQFQTANGPGWASPNGSWGDPRPVKNGPLPKDWAHYKGLYRHGTNVVLSYTVGGRAVLDHPALEAKSFTRTFRVEPGEREISMLVAEGGIAAPSETPRNGAFLMRSGKPPLPVLLLGSAQNARLHAKDGRVTLSVAPSKAAQVFKLVLLLGEDQPPEGFENSILDPKRFTSGGPSLWPEEVTTEGKLGEEDGPYAVDTLTPPFDNPWDSWIRFVAHDFFPDGSAALSTWNGDVWTVSGINEKLDRLTWRRFAAGVYEGLGLTIVKGQVYVLGRDQITRLHDLNGDGEADFYENFNNDGAVTASYHAFAMDLWTDPDGNFYYTRCGQRADPQLPLGGAMLRVSADGSRLEQFASGLRAANGMSIGPDGQITCSDNQGNWIPSARINLVEEGGFYGFVPFANRVPPPTEQDPPICWLPQQIDNSGGAQAWVNNGAWGLPQGTLLHTSYGKAALFLVFLEKINGIPQGGVLQFPLRFDSGIMRARFHPVDRQLYLSGLKGWQTAGGRDAAFQRVRYTGKPLEMPIAIRTRSNGLELTFSDALDAEDASNPDNYAIEQWNYLWSKEYGSKDYSVAKPGTIGRDKVAIKSAAVSSDGKRVFLEIPSLQPVMQMRIRYNVLTATDALLDHELYYTINRVPSASTAASK